MGAVSTSLPVELSGRDLLRISDLSPAEAQRILDLATELRANPKEALFPGATLGLYFAKHSTRTRVSFSVAMTHLGGSADGFTADELQPARGGSPPDTARRPPRNLGAVAGPAHPDAPPEGL